MDADRFADATRAFAQANSDDPSTVVAADGTVRPRELVRAERLARWVARLAPQASEALRLAAHCQHLRRWVIPRSDYPEGRTGYLRWRKDLSRFHADGSAEILSRAGYDAATVDRVRAINQKKSIKHDSDVQTMEDALCLVFLEDELEAFADKHEPAKVVDILRKTWAKMSDSGRTAALELELSPSARSLVERALAGG